MTAIIVNGKPRDVANDLIGYCGACHLADRPVAKGPYTIPVEHGLVLNVRLTGHA